MIVFVKLLFSILFGRKHLKNYLSNPLTVLMERTKSANTELEESMKKWVFGEIWKAPG